MKKILIVLFVLMFSIAFSQTVKEKVIKLNMEISQITQDINMLIDFHESGISQSVTLFDGTVINLSYPATGAEKAAYRAKIKELCDLRGAKNLEMKALIP